jgi:hypothetical protein
VSADADFRERFGREADIAAALSHPHIVGGTTGAGLRAAVDLDGVRRRYGRRPPGA